MTVVPHLALDELFKAAKTRPTFGPQGGSKPSPWHNNHSPAQKSRNSWAPTPE